MARKIKGLRYTGDDESGIPMYEHTAPYITGLYGCKCHPFNSWAECEAKEKEVFKIGDPVKHRCNEKMGEITKVVGDGYYHVSNMGLEHAANIYKW